MRTDPIFPCYFPSAFNQIGLATGIALAVILFLGFGAFSSLFSTDLEVLTIAWSGILVRNYKSESFTSWEAFFLLGRCQECYWLCSFDVLCCICSPFRSW
jgi:hypothetical protein